MVGHMLYDDYGIINGSENRCGFAFMVYSGGRWVIKWQANVGTMKLVKKKATGLFSKTEFETALVTIPPKVFATGSRAIEV
jgi:type VI secretion system secreted protein VgrG